MIQSKTFLNKILRSKRGESIMEVLVAMMVFTISLTALTLIIRFSLNMTMRQILDAASLQNRVNNSIVDVYLNDADTPAPNGVPSTLIFTQTNADGEAPVTSTHPVMFTDFRDITAFYPNP